MIASDPESDPAGAFFHSLNTALGSRAVRHRHWCVMSENFLERLKLEENIEMQAGILRYLVTQGGKHVLFRQAFFAKTCIRNTLSKTFFCNLGVYLVTGACDLSRVGVASSYASLRFWGQST